MDLLDEFLAIEGVNFDEISSLATSVDLFDSSKVMMNHGVDVPQLSSIPPPVPPQAQPQYCTTLDPLPTSPEFPSVQTTTPEPLVQQDLSPEPYSIQGLAANHLPQAQVDDQSYVMPDNQYLLVLQPAATEPFMPQALNSDAYYVQQQPASQHQLDLPLLLPVPSTEPQTISSSDSQLSSVSPWQVDHEEEEAALSAPQQSTDAPKKRVRKPKNPEGTAPSRRRTRKTKVYEMGPLSDEEQEKKRINAVNAKRHRDMQKEMKDKLSKDLTEARAKRDQLLELVNRYKQREQQLLQMINMRGININGLNHITLEGL